MNDPVQTEIDPNEWFDLAEDLRVRVLDCLEDTRCYVSYVDICNDYCNCQSVSVQPLGLQYRVPQSSSSAGTLVRNSVKCNEGRYVATYRVSIGFPVALCTDGASPDFRSEQSQRAMAMILRAHSCLAASFTCCDTNDCAQVGVGDVTLKCQSGCGYAEWNVERVLGRYGEYDPSNMPPLPGCE